MREGRCSLSVLDKVRPPWTGTGAAPGGVSAHLLDHPLPPLDL